MKNLVLLASVILFIVFATNATAQTIPTDTVCAGLQGKTYSVVNTAGSSYTWIVNGGTQASGGNTNSITVDWSSTPGVDTLMVVETSIDGCIGDTVKLAVRRMPLPTADISGTTAMCYSDSVNVTIDLTGTGPWTFTYTDGTTPVTINNHGSATYTFNTGLLSAGTTSYTLTHVEDTLGCIGSTSGSADITVSPKPVTSPIIY